MVIQDAGGNVLTAAIDRLYYGSEIKTTEGAGLRMGLKFAHDLCFQDLKAKSDSLEVVNAIQHKQSLLPTSLPLSKIVQQSVTYLGRARFSTLRGIGIELPTL